MGGDGGVAPNLRRFIVTTKAADQSVRSSVGRDTAGRMLWSTCDLSKEPLRHPIVLCPLGFLFNKEAVLHCLMGKSLPAEYSYIRSLKDLRPAILTPNPAFDEARSDDATVPFECPITGAPANGVNRFVSLSCGHVISRKAVEQACSDASSQNACPVCSKPVLVDDTRIVNPVDDDLVSARKALELRRLSLAEKKKTSKKSVSTSDSSSQPKHGQVTAPVAKKSKVDDAETDATYANWKVGRMDGWNKPDKPNLPFGASKMVGPVTYSVKKASNVGKSAHSANMENENYKSMFLSSSDNGKRFADAPSRAARRTTCAEE